MNTLGGCSLKFNDAHSIDIQLTANISYNVCFCVYWGKRGGGGGVGGGAGAHYDDFILDKPLMYSKSTTTILTHFPSFFFNDSFRLLPLSKSTVNHHHHRV